MRVHFVFNFSSNFPNLSAPHTRRYVRIKCQRKNFQTVMQTLVHTQRLLRYWNTKSVINFWVVKHDWKPRTKKANMTHRPHIISKYIYKKKTLRRFKCWDLGSLSHIKSVDEDVVSGQGFSKVISAFD